MRKTSDQERDIPSFDPLEKPGEKVETDLCVTLAPDLLGVEIPLSQRTEVESDLDQRVIEYPSGEGEDGSGDFLVVQVGEELVRPEFGLVGRVMTVQALIFIELDEGDERCRTDAIIKSALKYKSTNYDPSEPQLTLIQLLGLLLQKMPLLGHPEHINTENMKPRYPLMTLDVLLDAPRTLIREILADAAGTISQEMMCVFQGC